jgi:hypothetical protein
MNSKYFQTLNILWVSVLLAPIMMFTIVFVMLSDFRADIPFFNYFAPIACLPILFAGQWLYNQDIANINTLPDMKAKMQKYYVINIQRWAMVEATCLLITVTFLLNRTQWMIVVFGVLIAWLATLRPSRDKMISELELNGEGVEEMDTYARNWTSDLKR